jgi:hypothetical protein
LESGRGRWSPAGGQAGIAEKRPLTIAYVGHAEAWDRMSVDGDPGAHDCRVE